MKTLKNKLLVVLVSSFAIALSSTNVLNLHVQEKNIDVNNVQLLLPKVNLKIKNANEGNEGNFQVALTDGIMVLLLNIMFHLMKVLHLLLHHLKVQPKY